MFANISIHWNSTTFSRDFDGFQYFFFKKILLQFKFIFMSVKFQDFDEMLFFLMNHILYFNAIFIWFSWEDIFFIYFGWITIYFFAFLNAFLSRHAVAYLILLGRLHSTLWSVLALLYVYHWPENSFYFHTIATNS